MHLSAYSELKTELADSWIETKLPINEVGLLHVCLTEVSRFTCGCAEGLRRNPPLYRRRTADHTPLI
jgi:hypothetical protein